ncbi:MAG TPA: 2-phospho-L-lactate guanylyltransferase [Ilumatobacteraceae bacterium]|nr:2-phospho-L-lactate guanylyltransferase [Ilumatobacteraceae bacterium]HRB05301.1 2-phospho-L-lactate guanylyltransferase [Ilumatobacteraceae bacterium]
MNAVVLVPVKAFADAKARLSPVLSPTEREALARWTAERVLAAAGELPVFIACDSESVADWATAHAATVLWHPGVGLNAAVNNSVAELRRRGADHVVVAHGDLPLATNLALVVTAGSLTLVPDARDDGTNVASLPAALDFEFEYGAGSFHRHLSRAIAAGLPVTVRRDACLALDIDTPFDLTHPLVQEVLPAWLPTNRVSPTHRHH